MKYLVLLIVLVLLAVAGLLLFGGSGEVAEVSTKERDAARQAAAPRLDFGPLAKLLEQDMAQVPVSLDAPHVTPANAFSLKARLANAPASHPEYQTLVRACDLIIYADQEQAVRHAGAQLSTGGLGVNTNTAAHDKAQADWDHYRQQTADEVKRLLASLGSGGSVPP